jgi:hypothetical protein
MLARPSTKPWSGTPFWHGFGCGYSNKMASLVKLKLFCKVFGKMAVVVTSVSHVGKKPWEATIFGFTSIVQIAKWLLRDFNLEAVFFVRGLAGLL